MELSDLSFTMDGELRTLRVPHDATVRQVLRMVRETYHVSIFTSLELRINELRIQARRPVFRLSLGRETQRIEIIRRNCCDCL